MSSRDATITLNNNTDYELKYSSESVKDGKISSDHPLPQSIGPHSNASFKVEKSSSASLYGPEGHAYYNLMGGDTKYPVTVYWNHPNNDAQSTYQITGTRTDEYTTHPSGKDQTTTLDISFHPPSLVDTQQFVDGLYNPRSYSAVDTAVDAGEMVAAIAQSNQATVLNAWLSAWPVKAPSTPAVSLNSPAGNQDQLLMQFFSSYISGYNPGKVLLAVPQLRADGSTVLDGQDLPVYFNSGYSARPFVDDGGSFLLGSFDSSGKPQGGTSSQVAVSEFLYLLYFGAHFVSISSSEDSGQPLPLFRNAMQDFAKQTGVPTMMDLGDSHYTSTVNMGGKYWGSMSGDTVPDDGSLIFSLLTDDTSVYHENDFFQLEGWPANADLGRHNQDYQANETTYWNFSTYGASVYSEKRSAPIFLCPPDFDLTLHSDTKMPYYYGANAGNAGAGWMHPELMNI